MSKPRDIAKPNYGQPCNGCGKCCMDTVCPLGQFLFEQEEGPCPALEWADDKWRCGIILDPRKFAPVRVARYGVDKMRAALLYLLGPGLGCDAELEQDTFDPSFYAMMNRFKIKFDEERVEAARLWGWKWPSKSERTRW